MKWQKREKVACSKCEEALNIPYAHVHFHYGHEGLGEELLMQLKPLIGNGMECPGEDQGVLGQDICFDCFLELVEVLAKWRGIDLHGKKESDNA